MFEGRLKERFAVIAGRLSDGNRYLRFCPAADAERPSENAGGAFQTASDGVRASGAVADGVGQQGEHFFGGVPADAGIGDALAVGFGFVLTAFDEVAFHHHAHDVLFAVADLRRHVLSNFHLAGVVFAAVGVAAVYHQAGADSGFDQLGDCVSDVFRAVVRLFAAAQDDVAVGVARGVDDGRVSGFGNGEEVVRVGGRADGVDGDFEVAVGAVFEADGAGQAAGKFAVHLAFGGARADGAPGNEVGVILRGNHV